MCSNEDVNWDWRPSAGPGMHTNLPSVCVRSHENGSREVFSAATLILYILYLDESGLLHPCHDLSQLFRVSRIMTATRHHVMRRGTELWNGDWRETLTLICDPQFDS